MLFFYVGLGLAMFSIVIKVFEVSSSISKQSYINKAKVLSIDKVLIRNQNDKIFLQLLNGMEGISMGTGKDICLNIKNGITDESNPSYSILSKYSALNSYSVGNFVYSSHPKLSDGCSFNSGSHRVIVVPKKHNPNQYSIYSCIISIEPKCRFEIID